MSDTTSLARREAAIWLDEQAEHGYEYADNFRIAEVGNVEEEEAYDRAAERGCCGFFDTQKSFWGVLFRLGFNYGH